MDINERFEFNKWMYSEGLAYRDTLTKQMNLPLFGLTIVVGVLLKVSISIELHNYFPVSHFFFYLLLAVSCYFTIHSGYALYRSWYRYEYRLIPLADELEAYRVELMEYHPQGETGAQMAGEETKQAIIDDFVECASENGEINARRAASLNRSISMAIYAGVATLGVYFYTYVLRLAPITTNIHV